MIMGTRGSLRSGSISTITKLAAVGSDVAPSSHRHSVSSFRSASSRTPTASDSPGAGKVALYPNNRFHEGGHVVPKRSASPKVPCINVRTPTTRRCVESGPVFELPGVGKILNFEDPEGNVVAAVEYEPLLPMAVSGS